MVDVLSPQPSVLNLSADGVYPEPYFRQRLEEEAHRAHRMHAIITLILIQGDTATLAHKLRENIRRMDVLGLWKGFLGVLWGEIPRDEVAPVYGERLTQQAEGIMRIAGVVDTDWEEISFGACFMPDVKSGKIDPGLLLSAAEHALLESTQDHRPILYKGQRRFVEVQRTDGVTAAALLRVGDLHLQRDGYKGWIGAEVVEFLPKEYLLLQYFIKHEGKLIKRDHLCKSVWGAEGSNSRTLDMHIAKLRKKLKTSRHLAIKTLKGEGYRFDLTN
jgi:hypothetical protein